MGGNRPAGGELPALLALGGAFLLGGVAGCVLAGAVDGRGVDALYAYLTGYLTAARSGSTVGPGLLSLIWEQARWPLIAALLGAVVLGIPGLPILFALRGFFLTFSVGAFVRMFGPWGGVVSLPLFGVSSLFTIPVLFVLGVEGWTRLRGGGTSSRSARYIACAITLCVSVVVEYFLAPHLLAFATGLLKV